jgi:hypothetical protein
MMFSTHHSIYKKNDSYNSILCKISQYMLFSKQTLVLG